MKKFIACVLFVVLLFVFTFQVIQHSTIRALSSPKFYLTIFDDEVIYRAVPDIIFDELNKHPKTGALIDQLNPELQAEIKAVIAVSFSQENLQPLVVAAVQQTEDFFRGDSETLELKFDLTKQKAQLNDTILPKIDEIIRNYPVCTTAQLQQMSQQEVDRLPECLPPGINMNTLLSSFGGQAKFVASIPNEFDLTDYLAAQDDPKVQELMAKVVTGREGIGAIKAMVWLGYLFIVLLAGLITYLLVSSTTAYRIWVGVMMMLLALPSLCWSIGWIFFSRYFFLWFASTNMESSPMLDDLASALFTEVMYQFHAVSLWVSLLVFVGGVGVLVYGLTPRPPYPASATSIGSSGRAGKGAKLD